MDQDLVQHITRVQVEDLFGRVSYDFSLSSNSGISILTAPNGMGKTTILNFINFMFNPNTDSFCDIRRIPFSKFTCSLSNDKIVGISRHDAPIAEKTSKRKKKDSSDDSSISPILDWILNHGDFIFYIKSKESSDKVNSSSSECEIIYSKEFKEGRSRNPIYYMPSSTSENINYNQYQTDPSIPLNYIWKLQKEGLKNTGCHIPICYIRANRIQPVMSPEDDSKESGSSQQESPIQIASKDIGHLVTESIEEYNKSVYDAKDILPGFFLDGDFEKLDDEVFLDYWNDYQAKMVRFHKTFDIPYSEALSDRTDIISIYETDLQKRHFLNAYLHAFYSTTKPLEKMYNKLYIFQNILNEHNKATGKTVYYLPGSEKGYAFLKSRDGTIDFDSLSSGEKHLFLMYYNLIFKADKTTLVLIDEPEISLHIEWQESFLDELMKIEEMTGLQAIIATHSPYIVGSHYDLIIDKGGGGNV